MRTLQRLGHARPPRAGGATRVRLDEAQALRNERMRALRRVALIAAVVAALAAGAGWVVSRRTVTDGLVEAGVVVARAPASVRVVEVLCAVGERVERGQALLRLESTCAGDERRTLALAVEQRRLRLELARAGGDLGQNHVGRRDEVLVEALREERLADAEVDVIRARLEEMERTRQTVELRLLREGLASAGEVAALDARASGAEALAERARTEEDLARGDAQAVSSLERDGLTSRRERESATSVELAARRDVDERGAAARALRSEARTARMVGELDGELGAATLAELDAALETERRTLAAVETRRELWRSIGERRAVLTDGDVDLARLRALELRLLEVQVSEAEAQLADFDRRRGNGLVVAEADGVVGRVWVVPGRIVESGEPLVSTFDPAAQWVVAYVRPEYAAEFVPGRACRLVPEGMREALSAQVVSVGAALTRCPEALPHDVNGTADLRLPVRVQCRPEDRRRLLRPNMRVKVSVLSGEDAP